MPSETHSQRVLDLAGQRGLLRASDLDAIGAGVISVFRESSTKFP